MQLPAAEGVGGITVLATQRTACQAHKHRRQAGGPGFALQGMENFGNAQSILHISHGALRPTGFDRCIKKGRILATFKLQASSSKPGCRSLP
jgi:hypothetical protein